MPETADEARRAEQLKRDVQQRIAEVLGEPLGFHDFESGAYRTRCRKCSHSLSFLLHDPKLVAALAEGGGDV